MAKKKEHLDIVKINEMVSQGVDIANEKIIDAIQLDVKKFKNMSDDITGSTSMLKTLGIVDEILDDRINKIKKQTTKTVLDKDNNRTIAQEVKTGIKSKNSSEWQAIMNEYNQVLAQDKVFQKLQTQMAHIQKMQSYSENIISQLTETVSKTTAIKNANARKNGTGDKIAYGGIRELDETFYEKEPKIDPSKVIRVNTDADYKAYVEKLRTNGSKAPKFYMGEDDNKSISKNTAITDIVSKIVNSDVNNGMKIISDFLIKSGISSNDNFYNIKGNLASLMSKTGISESFLKDAIYNLISDAYSGGSVTNGIGLERSIYGEFQVHQEGEKKGQIVKKGDEVIRTSTIPEGESFKIWHPDLENIAQYTSKGIKIIDTKTREDLNMNGLSLHNLNEAFENREKYIQELESTGGDKNVVETLRNEQNRVLSAIEEAYNSTYKKVPDIAEKFNSKVYATKFGEDDPHIQPLYIDDNSSEGEMYERNSSLFNKLRKRGVIEDYSAISLSSKEHLTTQAPTTDKVASEENAKKQERKFYERMRANGLFNDIDIISIDDLEQYFKDSSNINLRREASTKTDLQEFIGSGHNLSRLYSFKQSIDNVAEKYAAKSGLDVNDVLEQMFALNPEMQKQYETSSLFRTKFKEAGGFSTKSGVTFNRFAKVLREMSSLENIDPMINKLANFMSTVEVGRGTGTISQMEQLFVKQVGSKKFNEDYFKTEGNKEDLLVRDINDMDNISRKGQLPANLFKKPASKDYTSKSKKERWIEAYEGKEILAPYGVLDSVVKKDGTYDVSPIDKAIETAEKMLGETTDSQLISQIKTDIRSLNNWKQRIIESQVQAVNQNLEQVSESVQTTDKTAKKFEKADDEKVSGYLLRKDNYKYSKIKSDTDSLSGISKKFPSTTSIVPTQTALVSEQEALGNFGPAVQSHVSEIGKAIDIEERKIAVSERLVTQLGVEKKALEETLGLAGQNVRIGENAFTITGVNSQSDGDEIAQNINNGFIASMNHNGQFFKDYQSEFLLQEAKNALTMKGRESEIFTENVVMEKIGSNAYLDEKDHKYHYTDSEGRRVKLEDEVSASQFYHAGKIGAKEWIDTPEVLSMKALVSELFSKGYADVHYKNENGEKLTQRVTNFDQLSEFTGKDFGEIGYNEASQIVGNTVHKMLELTTKYGVSNISELTGDAKEQWNSFFETNNNLWKSCNW